MASSMAGLAILQWVCLGWFSVVGLVTTIGTVQIFRHYRRPPAPPVSTSLETQNIPHVTIIRPCKGLEPCLYECLASTFHTHYPHLTVYFCVASRCDAAYPVLQQLLTDYPDHDARIYTEEDDPVVQSSEFGPNPKIRNMSRAYREAKGDIIWILDCNIWVSQGALGRLVDKLCGFTNHQRNSKQAQTHRPYKLVAHLPICVDVDNSTSTPKTTNPSTIPLIPPSSHPILKTLTGSLLEQSFLSTAHAKMYVAINSVSIAPCINGKSTAFRRSHLNQLTHNHGIDYFSHNICEDHLIGDLLWKSPVLATSSETNPNGFAYRNHGLAVGDLAIQPVSGMIVSAYIARRVRWLRVRKFTVILATLVEPGTESLVCCAMGAFGCVSFESLSSGIAKWLIWFGVFLGYWCLVDWFVSGVILGMGSVSPIPEGDGFDQAVVFPSFTTRQGKRRGVWKWFRAWISREALALPVWTWAIWGGTQVTWRDRTFRVGMDMRVHEIVADGDLDNHIGQADTANDAAGPSSGGAGSAKRSRKLS